MTSVETELVIPAALMEAGEADHHDRLAEPFVEEHPPVAAAASSSSGAQDPEEAARAQDNTKNLLIGMALPESDIFPAPAEGTEKARVMIVTIGTRGDIQPFLALGAALQRAGYLVLMLSHGVFGDSIRQGGLHFTPLEGDPGQIMGSPEFRHAFYEGGVMEQIKIFTTGMEEALDQNMRILARAAEELRADCILYSVTTLVDAVAVGVKLGIPTYYVSTIPFQNTSEFPPVAAMASPFALGFMNSMMHSLVWKIGWTMFDKRVNRFRKELGLPEWTKYDPVGYPGTCIYSPLIQPKPRDWAE
ncbi:MAG: glycosyltransferase, partial [archaeon]|nr:glycosyltransferase [archaeon]